VIAGTISTGDFVAFISYLGLITWPMMAMGWVVNLVQRGRASLDRIEHILETQPDVTDGADGGGAPPSDGDLNLADVSFWYDSAARAEGAAPALADVSLHVPRGSVLGIVGPPGSGKTTLLNLVPRIYDPTEGRVCLGGADIRDLDLKALRRQITWIPQEPFLFAGSIRSNIAFDRTHGSSPALDDAVRAAALDADVADFPAGLDTVVGERGVILSGGQKQRLALARAFFKPASILVLDDPISQVDTVTGDRIVRAVRTLAGSRTILVASHRLSAVRFADRIIVLDQGRIVESGNHDELMATDGYYAATFRLQALEEELNAA
jgi:ATP-binding cassette subfamily B protein